MIEVKEWISFDESCSYEESFGGIGGFFADGMRWKDYIEHNGFEEKGLEYAEAIKQSVIENEIRDDGRWHQNSRYGVPLFSDNTVATFSYRAWGDLLAAIWSEHDNKDYCYMDFY